MTTTYKTIDEMYELYDSIDNYLDAVLPNEKLNGFYHIEEYSFLDIMIIEDIETGLITYRIECGGVLYNYTSIDDVELDWIIRDMPECTDLIYL